MTAIKTDKQVYFNRIIGEITELNDLEKFANITLSVGHEKKRDVNMVASREMFKKIKSEYKIGDRIKIQFFVSSRFKHGRWYTMVNVLEIMD